MAGGHTDWPAKVATEDTARLAVDAKDLQLTGMVVANHVHLVAAGGKVARFTVLVQPAGRLVGRVWTHSESSEVGRSVRVAAHK